MQPTVGGGLQLSSEPTFADCTELWLPLLQSLTAHVPRWLVWKNAESSAGLSAAALARSVVVLLIPGDVGVAILRQNGAPARSVLLPLSIALVGLGATAGATIGVCVLTAGRRSFRTRIVTTNTWLNAAIWWWQFRAALAESSWPRPARPTWARTVATRSPLTPVGPPPLRPPEMPGD